MMPSTLKLKIKIDFDYKFETRFRMSIKTGWCFAVWRASLALGRFADPRRVTRRTSYFDLFLEETFD